MRIHSNEDATVALLNPLLPILCCSSPSSLQPRRTKRSCSTHVRRRASRRVEISRTRSPISSRFVILDDDSAPHPSAPAPAAAFRCDARRSNANDRCRGECVIPYPFNSRPQTLIHDEDCRCPPFRRRRPGLCANCPRSFFDRVEPQGWRGMFDPSSMFRPSFCRLTHDP